jgi:flagellar motility protein MotE (MotC chaperone)
MKLRVLPIVMTGVALLLVLKGTSLLLTGHYTLTETYKEKAERMAVEANYRPSAAAHASNSWNKDVYDPIVTGSLPPKKEEAPAPTAGDAAAKPAEPDAKPGDAPAAGAKPAVPPDSAKPEDSVLKDIQDKDPNDLTSAEKALLDRLQARRQELDTREQELNLRENLLRAAEKKIDDQIIEMKALEERLATLEAARKSEEGQKLKDLVTMYENMKPKQAAAIFDRLEMKVLVDVAVAMNPKKTSDIIARMEPAAAERLTVALAKREIKEPAATTPQELPKIEGEKPKQP